MTKPTRPNRSRLLCIRQESRQAATTSMERAIDPLPVLSPEMIEALEEMIDALPGGRLSTMTRCNRN